MKLVRSTGRVLEVRSVGPVLLRLLAGPRVPLKHNGWQIMDDGAARALVRELLTSELYEKGEVT